MTSVECEICTRETTESLAKCSLTVSLSRRNSALKMSSHWAATVPADSVHLSHLTKSVKGKKGEVILLCSVPFWLWGAPLSSSHQENVVFFFTKANNSPCLQALWFDMVKSPFFPPLPLCLWSHKVRGSFTLSFSFPALSPPNLPKLHDRGPELHTIKAYNTHVNTHRCRQMFICLPHSCRATVLPFMPPSSASLGEGTAVVSRRCLRSWRSKRHLLLLLILFVSQLLFHFSFLRVLQHDY